MKLNYFKSMLLMSSMLFVASCSQEELVSDSLGNTVEAKFTIETPEGINSRAVGDGYSATHVVCAVFDESDKKEEMRELRKVLPLENKRATYNIRLVKGQNYRVAFFAYNPGAEAYDVTDMKNIQVLDTQLSNKEERDAFTAFTEISEGETMQPINRTVTLYRPFAQLNLGAYTEDIEAARKAGVVIEKTSVKVTNVYKTFSAYDDAVVGETSDMEFALNGLVDEYLYADINNDGTDEEYEYLALNYLLVGNYGVREETKALTDVTFTWQAEGGKTNDPVATFKNVPVQRNYRTNIIGWLLTNPAQFNIVIDEKFEKPDYNVGEITPVQPTEEGVFEVDTYSELSWIAQQINADKEGKFEGKSIKLMADIDMAGSEWASINMWSPEKKGLAVIDGNGKKISNMTVKGAGSLGFIGSYASSSVLTIKNLTFVNPVVESSASFVGTVVGYTYGNVTLENVKVTGAQISTTAEKGIRLGGLVGLYPADAVQPLTLNQCVVEESTITGYHNLAGLVGSTMGSNATMTDCQSNNNTFYHRAENAASWQNYDANGYAAGKAVKTGCTTVGNKGLLSDGVTLNVAGEYEISNAAGMLWFADQVNEKGKNFAGKTVKLVKEVDLKDIDWKPIGQTGATEFKGVFDGGSNAIYNLTINNTDESANCATGLFGWVESHGDENVTIKNVTVMSPQVYGHHNVGVIVGYVYGKVEYCTVWDAKLECVSANDDANGDKCGAIAGYVGEDASIKGCHVNGSLEIKAGRDAGVVAGAAKPACVTGCKINNPEMVSVTANGTSTGANIRSEVIGREL